MSTTLSIVPSFIGQRFCCGRDNAAAIEAGVAVAVEAGFGFSRADWGLLDLATGRYVTGPAGERFKLYFNGDRKNPTYIWIAVAK